MLKDADLTVIFRLVLLVSGVVVAKKSFSTCLGTATKAKKVWDM